MKISKLKANSGSVSIIVILLMITMILCGIFAVIFSYSTRQNSVNIVGISTDYYNMDSKAEEKLAIIDGDLYQSEKFARTFLEHGAIGDSGKIDLSEYAKNLLVSNGQFFSDHGERLMNSIYFYKSTRLLQKLDLEIIYPEGIKSSTDYLDAKNVPNKDSLYQVKYKVNNSAATKDAEKKLAVTLNVLPLRYHVTNIGNGSFTGTRDKDFVKRYEIVEWSVE